MKKLLFTFSLLVAMSSFALAQGVININGYVTDVNGNAMGSYPVEVMSDSISGINFYMITYTNNNGYYSVNANVGTVTVGGFYVWTQDSCTLGTLSQTVYFSPNIPMISSVDFTICANGGGGSNCAASFTHTTNPNGVVTYSGSATGGQAPYSYYWTLDNGMTSTGQNTSVAYTSGMYMTCLTITDAAGCANITCDTVSVNVGGGGSNCAASFSYQPTAAGSIGFASSVTGTTGAVSYMWDFGDGNTNTTANPIHTYNSPASFYSVCLTISDANNCISTYCDSVVINSGSLCTAGMFYSTNNTLNANFSAAATGTAPFTYAWDFGDNNMGTSTIANPSYTYAANGTYYACVTITDATGCISTDCSSVTVNVSTSGSLNVFVVTDTLSNLPTQAVVYLIEHDTVAGTLTAIQIDTVQQGFATFTNVPFGDYLVKAALLSTDPNYGSYFPTYSIQSLTWSGATGIPVTPNSIGFTYIDLIQGANVGTGPGFIGGLISQGANRGPGDPFVGALVILYDANMNPIGYTYTDVDGGYSFGNLPYGVYYVYIEELGLATAPVEVTLSATTPTMDQVHFDVELNSVRFTSTNETLSVSGLKVYPNPVTNQLYMQFELDQAIDADISIINVTGQVFSNFQRTLNGGSNLIEVSTNELPAGVYTIFLKSKAGVVTQKFIKQ